MAPAVEISTGKLRGAFVAGIYAFKGIPYAAPPAGANRFMPPEAPQPWAGVRDAPIRWRLVQKPTFDNQFATVELKGRRAKMKIEKSVPGDWEHPKIEVTLERELA